MPKRVIDGEGIWRSDKLARVEPEWVRAEYANLIPSALANGVFEANPRRVWSQVYSYNRPEIDLEDVEMILGAFKKVGLLFSWLDPSGKVWGFWVGIEKSGRLPPPSRLKQRHEVVGPVPPAEELQKYIESTNGSQWLANGYHGFGFGFGSGSGSGTGAHPSDELAQVKRPSPYSFEGIELRITEKEHRGFVAAFRSLDLEQEYREMDAWLVANPKQRKKNHGRFARAWLKRSDTNRKEAERQGQAGALPPIRPLNRPEEKLA